MSEQRRRTAVSTPLVGATLAVALLGVAPAAPRTTGPATSTAAKPNGTATLTGGSGDSGNGKNQGGGNDKKDFLIAGNVAGLYPGASAPLTVTVTNLNNFAIQVTSLSATVADPAGPCPAGAVQVDPMSGSLVVPGNGTATTTLVARMSNDPSNACKSTTFGLAYKGTAVKA